MWVSIVRLAVRPILSTAFIQEANHWVFVSEFPKVDLTFSTSTSGISPTASTEEKVKWFILMRGKIRWVDMISEERLYPEKHVSHLHLNDSHSKFKARSYASKWGRCSSGEKKAEHEQNSLIRRLLTWNLQYRLWYELLIIIRGFYLSKGLHCRFPRKVQVRRDCNRANDAPFAYYWELEITRLRLLTGHKQRNKLPTFCPYWFCIGHQYAAR